jgi:hypothetical protein
MMGDKRMLILLVRPDQDQAFGLPLTLLNMGRHAARIAASEDNIIIRMAGFDFLAGKWSADNYCMNTVP